ncbi:MAG: HAD-IA family hydrolase [Desulfobacterales bacterium]|nr:HAD-IA family hydrolase [Desulfobacterales bacterium]
MNFGMDLKELICNAEIVSFDIFDTLLCRNVLEARDVFKLVEKKLKLDNVNLDFSFAHARYNVELNLRSEIKALNKREISFELIYQRMQELYNLSDETFQTLKNTEISAEFYLSQPKKQAFEVYKLAKSLNKKIIAISDTYFDSETVFELLRKGGYSLDRLFLSAEYMATKHQGELFDLVVENLKINPEKVLHIGDNYESDIINASKRGFITYYIPKNCDYIYNEIDFEKA